MKTIKIKMINGTKYTIDTHDNTTVLELKHIIEETLNVCKQMQRLIFNGSPLEDHLILPNNCVVHLLLQLASIDE